MEKILTIWCGSKEAHQQLQRILLDMNIIWFADQTVVMNYDRVAIDIMKSIPKGVRMINNTQITSAKEADIDVSWLANI